MKNTVNHRFDKGSIGQLQRRDNHMEAVLFNFNGREFLLYLVLVIQK